MSPLFPTDSASPSRSMFSRREAASRAATVLPVRSTESAAGNRFDNQPAAADKPHPKYPPTGTKGFLSRLKPNILRRNMGRGHVSTESTAATLSTPSWLSEKLSGLSTPRSVSVASWRRDPPKHGEQGSEKSTSRNGASRPRTSMSDKISLMTAKCSRKEHFAHAPISVDDPFTGKLLDKMEHLQNDRPATPNPSLGIPQSLGPPSEQTGSLLDGLEQKFKEITSDSHQRQEGLRKMVLMPYTAAEFRRISGRAPSPPPLVPRVTRNEADVEPTVSEDARHPAETDTRFQNQPSFQGYHRFVPVASLDSELNVGKVRARNPAGSGPRVPSHSLNTTAISSKAGPRQYPPSNARTPRSRHTSSSTHSSIAMERVPQHAARVNIPSPAQRAASLQQAQRVLGRDNAELYIRAQSLCLNEADTSPIPPARRVRQRYETVPLALRVPIPRASSTKASPQCHEAVGLSPEETHFKHEKVLHAPVPANSAMNGSRLCDSDERWAQDESASHSSTLTGEHQKGPTTEERPRTIKPTTQEHRVTSSEHSQLELEDDSHGQLMEHSTRLSSTDKLFDMERNVE